MINKIIADSELFAICRCTCEENGVGVQICGKLLNNKELKDDLISILKVDGYYHSKQMHNPPASIDCLIVVRTGQQEFGLTLVELRNVSTARDLKPTVIRPKFDTTIDRFLSSDFGYVFLCSEYEISSFQLWLVTNPYGWPHMPEDQYRSKVRGTVLEMYLSDKPYRFRGRIASITHKRPNPEICLPSENSAASS